MAGFPTIPFPKGKFPESTKVIMWAFAMVLALGAFVVAIAGPPTLKKEEKDPNKKDPIDTIQTTLNDMKTDMKDIQTDVKGMRLDLSDHAVKIATVQEKTGQIEKQTDKIWNILNKDSHK